MNIRNVYLLSLLIIIFLLKFNVQLSSQTLSIDSLINELEKELFPSTYSRSIILNIKRKDTTIVTYGRDIQPDPVRVSNLLRQIRKVGNQSMVLTIADMYLIQERLFIQEWGPGAKFADNRTMEMFEINSQFETTLFSFWIDSLYEDASEEKYLFIKNHILDLFTYSRGLSQKNELKYFSNYYQFFPKKVNSALIYLKENSSEFESFIIQDLLNHNIENYYPSSKDYYFYLYYVDLPSLLIGSDKTSIDSFMILNYENYFQKNALFWFYQILGSRGSDDGVKFYVQKMISRDTLKLNPEIQYSGFFKRSGVTEKIIKELIFVAEQNPLKTDIVIDLIKHFPTERAKGFLTKISSQQQFKDKALNSLKYLNQYNN